MGRKAIRSAVPSESGCGTDDSPGTDSLEIRAFQIAGAPAAAQWAAGGSGSVEEPLGVVAALCLVAALYKPGVEALLRRIWGLFGITRPELCIRGGPLARWLEDATQHSSPRRRLSSGPAAMAAAPPVSKLS
jgi:hypothetical protein